MFFSIHSHEKCALLTPNHTRVRFPLVPPPPLPSVNSSHWAQTTSAQRIVFMTAVTTGWRLSDVGHVCTHPCIRESQDHDALRRARSTSWVGAGACILHQHRLCLSLCAQAAFRQKQRPNNVGHVTGKSYHNVCLMFVCCTSYCRGNSSCIVIAFDCGVLRQQQTTIQRISFREGKPLQKQTQPKSWSIFNTVLFTAIHAQLNKVILHLFIEQYVDFSSSDSATSENTPCTVVGKRPKHVMYRK